MCLYMLPPKSSELAQLEIDRRLGARRDRHFLLHDCGLVVDRTAVPVNALGAEALVPHRDAIGAGGNAVDAVDAPRVADREVRAVVDVDPSEHVGVGVTEDLDGTGPGELTGDLDDLTRAGQGQVEHRLSAGGR